MSSSWVEQFGASRPESPRLGGKGASLCRLVQLGYRVPPGLVITVDAFRAVCQSLGLNGADIGESAQARLLGARIPDSIFSAIQSAVDRLGLWAHNRDGLIVRSSATVEDSQAHSFAGIFESIPIHEPEQLEPTIRQVWASVFSPRALTYYREIGLKELPAMAVVVQRFLEAERSGVMFTRFDGRTLVEHVEGGCEKLVKGEVTPEQLWIAGPGAAPGDSGPLDPRHAAELSRLARSLEEHLGGPQDVEWVLADGVVHVVQSRPITTMTLGADPGSAGIGDRTPILTGIAASGGWGVGPVKLVFNIEDALALETGQVLVTPMTNPDMVVAMRKSAAIVTDVGGMICHAAIVSRELGLPCVVGTAAATRTLVSDEVVSVLGTTGAVFQGRIEYQGGGEPGRRIEWPDLWAVWSRETRDRPRLIPEVSTVLALETIPPGIGQVILVPDLDLRCSATGLWADLEGMAAPERARVLDGYFLRVREIAGRKSLTLVGIRPESSSIAALVRHHRFAAPLALDLDASAASAPLGAMALHHRPQAPPLAGMRDATSAALDTLKFFGHVPGSTTAPMPRPEWRRTWWDLLPEYGKFHEEYRTGGETGLHTWLEVRPELVISALLKSLVQPGFEMVPRVMGFPGVPPMYIKWIKCRYYFRSDAFARTWQSIVRATWSAEYMAELMRRVRQSYVDLAEASARFPETDSELAAATPDQMDALVTMWWPRWVEFFALCWFIQAQGDDIAYPFIHETISDHLARLGARNDAFAWPDATELVAPTTPVMSGEYMASMGRLREALLAAGLDSTDVALAALDRGEQPAIAGQLARHLEEWHWMRDRDLLFEPWDTPRRVITTALKTDPHRPANYQANLTRNLLALSVHFDLARASGRAGGLNLAARFLHDLNVERENHHVLWLKNSYPLRRMVLEVERRLVALGSLEPGDIFFLQAPELIAAIRRLPAPLPAELIGKVKNRRQGFRYEARLAQVDPATLVREDDYY